MIGAIIAWGIYSAYLRKQTFNVSLLALSSYNLYIWS